MEAPTPAAPTTVGIAADDLTGANDTAVQFARTGWSTRLALGDLSTAGGGRAGGTGATGRQAVAVVSDARAMAPERARDATGSAVAALLAAGVDHLYLKIDSTMRGSIPAQVEGAVQAWSRVHAGAWAVVCPAYPPMGRTVEDGVLYVNGEPVAETVIGSDPVTPVRTSVIAELVPGSAQLTGDLAGAGAEVLAQRLRDAAGDRDGAVGSRVVVVDARTEQDLAVLAEAIDRIGPHVVPVGSAGLAIAVATTWGRADAPASPTDIPGAGNGTVLVVVSSLHSVSRAQAEALADGTSSEDITVLAPALEDLTTSSPTAWLEQTLPASEGLPRVVLLLSPLERADAGAAASVADALARIAHVVLERHHVGALVLVGGDGAGAVLDRIGATSIKVAGTVQEGIPVGRIEGGTSEGLTVVTKAGGFGPPDALVEVVAALTAR